MTFQHIGMIGLGNLGGHIAKSLADNGTLHVYDLDPARSEAAAEYGAVIEPSAAAVARASDIVVLSLPESDAVSQACCGPNGILSSGKRGLLVVDTTSGYPTATLETAARLKTAGIRMIEATITGREGGPAAARKRTLTLMVGGDPGDVAEARPLLDRIATHVIVCGPLGTGQIVKMVNNVCSAVAIVTTIEGMLVAAKHGIAPDVVAAALREGTGHNFAADHVDLLRQPPTDLNVFAVGLMTKDLRNMSTFARESGVPTMMSDVVFHLHEIFTSRLGYEAHLLRLREVMEEWSGVRLDFGA
jgi:3-hydroxyisobutyrate dehydrogenase